MYRRFQTRLPLIKGLLLVTVLVQAARGQAGEDRLLGELSELTHEVKGTVYARGDRTLVIKNFYYDGLGPQGFFFVGTEGKPLQGGRLVPYPQGAGDETILEAAEDETVVLELPDDLKVADLAYLTIWCRRFSVTFGTILLNGKNGENDSATCADSKAANLPASVRGASAVALVQLLLFRKLPQL